MTPQLALRVAVLGSFALAMFAIIFFRLWFLQVLSGNQYLAQARTNRVRDVSIAAPRGEILDSSGNVLVQSVPSTTVQISPPDLPSSPRARRRDVPQAGVSSWGCPTSAQSAPWTDRASSA